MSSSEGYVTVEEGVRLFYEKVGSGGKMLILINGFYYLDDFKYLAESRTIISLDLRNRGRSNYITDSSKLQRGVLNDVEDIDAVRRHFGLNQIDLLAHSYAAKTVLLYAMKYPADVGRVVSIAPMQPDESRKYPPHLTNIDPILHDFFAKAAALQRERQSMDPQEFCGKFWTLLKTIYVADPNHASRIHWDRCGLTTELNLMSYLMQHLLPSIQAATPSATELAAAQMPVLIVHGTKDRSSPYGGGLDWSTMLPNAHLLSLDNVAHAPWLEAPERVFGAIQTFLDGV
jgi:proline iminopeptidase